MRAEKIAMMEGGATHIICRGGATHNKRINVKTMGMLGHIPRLLNAARIYGYRKFDHRIWDINLFESFCRKQVAHIEFDIAHVWDYCPLLINQLIECGKKVILDVPIAPTRFEQSRSIELRTLGLADSPRIFGKQMEALKQANIILAPSTYVAEVLKDLNIAPKRIRIAPFGVDPSPNDGEKKKVRFDSEGIKYCFVGNVNNRKGIPELIEAWQDPAFANDKLNLCGRINPEITKVLNKTQSANIHLSGFVDPSVYLREADIFVLPSWREGCAKAILEAMASGVPVIVTRQSGSVVTHGKDGFVFEAGDTDTLVKHMKTLKYDIGLRHEMGRLAAETAQMYTWKRYAQTVIDVYGGVGY